MNELNLEQYKTLFDLSRDLMCIADNERFIAVNPAWKELGYTQEEMLAGKFIDFVHPDDVEKTLKEAAKLDAGSWVTINFSNRYRAKNGEYRWLTWTGVPGTNHIVYGVARDDTEKKLAEEAMQRDLAERKILQDKLEYTNKELEQFAYIASHDLKSPLRGMSNLVSWIEEEVKGKLTKEGERYMEMFKEKVKHMNLLIEGILQYSRIGRVYKSSDQIDLNTILADVLTNLDKKNFTINVCSLPTVPGNKMTLTQLFTNLIGNGIKHHSRDDGKIDVTLQDKDTHWVFSVKDDGPGIDPKYHHLLFGMFQTLKPKNSENTGIGLALCKKIAEEAGGSIRLESDLGKGAEFLITWPK